MAEGGSANIIVGGAPPTRVLLEPIADELTARGHRVECWFGPMEELVRRDSWAQAEMFVCCHIPCGARELALAPRLHTLLTPTIGYDWIDAEAASAAGIAIVNARVAENAESMAEATMLFVLASLYDLQGAEAELRGDRQRRPARMLQGKTVGVVGYGNIARCVVRRLNGWDVDILAYSRSCSAAGPVEFVPLDTLLERSDVVVVLASLNLESYHLIDADRLALLRPDAVLVNMSRGPLIDERALEARLAAGLIHHVALDVFEQEPLPADSALRSFPGVILTPHSIGHTVESFAAIPRVTIANTLQAAAGTLPDSLCNCDVAAAWIRRFPSPPNSVDNAA